MVNEKVIAAIRAVRTGSTKRNFKQSFDMSVNFRSLDIKKPEGKIKVEVRLPHPVPGVKIGIFTDMMIPQAKRLGERVTVISKEQLESYSKNRKAAKQLAKSVSGFLAEAPLMPAVAKNLGPVLAVRGKMPKPISPTLPDLTQVVDSASSTIRLAVKDSPVVHARVGTEEMNDEQVADNVEVILRALITALPKGKEQIKDAVLKLTMSKPTKFQVSI